MYLARSCRPTKDLEEIEKKDEAKAKTETRK